MQLSWQIVLRHSIIIRFVQHILSSKVRYIVSWNNSTLIHVCVGMWPTHFVSVRLTQAYPNQELYWRFWFCTNVWPLTSHATSLSPLDRKNDTMKAVRWSVLTTAALWQNKGKGREGKRRKSQGSRRLSLVVSQATSVAMR